MWSILYKVDSAAMVIVDAVATVLTRPDFLVFNPKPSFL